MLLSPFNAFVCPAARFGAVDAVDRLGFDFLLNAPDVAANRGFGNVVPVRKPRVRVAQYGVRVVNRRDFVRGECFRHYI